VNFAGNLELRDEGSINYDNDGAATITIPADLQNIFDTTPLLKHEDPQPYLALRQRYVQDIKPRDTTEWIWLKDVVDLTWRIEALERTLTALLDAGKKRAVVEIFERRWERRPIMT
jgi:hypothetical protein